MKTLFISFMLLTGITALGSPLDSFEVVNGKKVFNIAEHMPEYQGGEKALMEYISTNVKYPIVDRRNNVQGRVIVRFIINEDGSVSDASIYRGVSNTLDAEALRLIRSLPNFKPATQSGQPVKTFYIIPILFKLSNE